MFSIPAADDVLPNSKNHGLKPSDDFLLNIRRCCSIGCQLLVTRNEILYLDTHLREIGDDETEAKKGRKHGGEPVMLLKIVSRVFYLTQDMAYWGTDRDSHGGYP